jgi:hypothetical protein
VQLVAIRLAGAYFVLMAGIATGMVIWGLNLV